jgi:hypothetical protein
MAKGKTRPDAPTAPAAGDQANPGSGAPAADETLAAAAVTPPAPDFAAMVDEIAASITVGATPVVRVSAVRDRWRAKRFWPKGHTDLTAAEAEQLGEAGFAQLRGDDVFTIVPLTRAD